MSEDLFSYRNNLRTPKPFQSDNIDQILRNKLWNIVYKIFSSHISDSIAGYDNLKFDEKYNKIAEVLWGQFFGLALDEMPTDADNYLQLIKRKLSSCIWHEVYSFLEFLSKYLGWDFNQYKNDINRVLEQENSAYRMMDNKIIAPIISASEIKSINTTLNISQIEIKNHLDKSIQHLSNKPNPDFANSVKESTSALESFLIYLINNDKSYKMDKLTETLGKLGIHKALCSMISKLWGFASDTARHGAKTDPYILTHAHALYILVSVSATINFLDSVLKKK